MDIEHLIIVKLFINWALRLKDDSFWGRRLRSRLINSPLHLQKIARILSMYDNQSDINKSLGRIYMISELSEISKSIKDPLIDIIVFSIVVVSFAVILVVLDMLFNTLFLSNIIFISFIFTWSYVCVNNSHISLLMNIHPRAYVVYCYNANKVVKRCIKALRYDNLNGDLVAISEQVSEGLTDLMK